jgi:hypothetical protein
MNMNKNHKDERRMSIIITFFTFNAMLMLSRPSRHIVFLSRQPRPSPIAGRQMVKRIAPVLVLCEMKE